MFAERNKRRILHDGIDEISNQLLALRHTTEPSDLVLRSKLQNQLSSRNRKLDMFESKLLVNKAMQLGIEVPFKGSWWLDDSEEQYMSGVPTNILNELTTSWLSPAGRMMVSALIREKKDERFERKFKIAVTAIAALTGLAGTLIGLLVTLSKCR